MWYAFDNNLDLKAELAEVKVEAGECEIPATVAEALRRHFIWLLRGVKSEDKPPRRDLFGATVILYAKPMGGKMLAGKMPLEFFKYKNLATIDGIVENLMRVCDAPEDRRNELFADILRETADQK